MERLENDTKLTTEWFENNSIKLNEVKCHLFVADHGYETLWSNIGEARLWESKNEKLLGLVINRNLNFDDHVFILCRKAARKLTALSRISNYTRILFKAFVESQLDIAH